MKQFDLRKFTFRNVRATIFTDDKHTATNTYEGMLMCRRYIANIILFSIEDTNVHDVLASRFKSIEVLD